MIMDITLVDHGVEGEYKINGNYDANEESVWKDVKYMEFSFYSDDVSGEKVFRGKTWGQFTNGTIYNYGAAVKLKRGTYDVRFQKYSEVSKQAEGETFSYPKKVMAGLAYPVQIKLSVVKTESGQTGIYIRIDSSETEIGDREIYYSIQGREAAIENIKYFLPMRGSRGADFFVAVDDPGVLVFGSDPDAKYRITVL